MCKIFLILVLANLCVAFWGQMQPRGNTVRPLIFDQDVQSLVLLSEIEKIAPTHCYSVGPYQSFSTVARMTEVLNKVGITAKRRKEQNRILQGYRAYIPSLPSVAATKKMTRALKRDGIDDFYVISDSNDKSKINAISLGLFSEKTRALKHASQLRRMGYVVQVEPRYRIQTIFWLDLQVAEENIDISFLEKIGAKTAVKCREYR